MRLTAILLLAILATGCAREKQGTTTGETSVDIPPLVSLCRSIDYSDTAHLHSEPYMKQTVGKIVRLMSVTDSVSTHEALRILLNGLKRDKEAIRKTNSLIKLYLDNPASPARDETKYIRYLRALLTVDSIPEGLRSESEEQLRIAMLNRPGTIATDFRYLDRKGSEGSLHEFEAPKIMLIFYDPECPHCPEILNKIATRRSINKAIEDGMLRVLAIYAEGKRDVWNKTKWEMPRNWTIGYDLTGILDNELYDLPAMPIIYILDGEHRVLEKDAMSLHLSAMSLQKNQKF